jgi:hypothetical protein
MNSKLLILLVLGSQLFACHIAPLNTSGYTILQQLALPDELFETSGLYCPTEGKIYSINDSGNEPVIYQLSESGQIETAVTLNAKNKDWEAITGDQTHFYVADIGNNAGKRKSIAVYRYSKHRRSATAVKSTEIKYKNNIPADNEYLQHDFDAEALVAKGKHLVLFSKSWKSKSLNVYLLDKASEEQNAQAFVTVDNMPGVDTGADYYDKNKRYILVGYRRADLGLGEPFIAVLNMDFELQYWHELQGFGQVEGYVSVPKGEVWFTQEDYFFGENSLC